MLCVTVLLNKQRGRQAREPVKTLWAFTVWMGNTAHLINVAMHPGQCVAKHGTAPSACGSQSAFKTVRQIFPW